MGVLLGQELLCAPPAVCDLPSGIGLDTLAHRQVELVNERVCPSEPEGLVKDIGKVHEFILGFP